MEDNKSLKKQRLSVEPTSEDIYIVLGFGRFFFFFLFNFILHDICALG